MDHQIGAKTEKLCSTLTNVLHIQEITTALKNTEVMFFPPKLPKPFATNGCGDQPCFQMPVQKATHTEGSSHDRQRITW